MAREQIDILLKLRGARAAVAEARAASGAIAGTGAAAATAGSKARRASRGSRLLGASLLALGRGAKLGAIGLVGFGAIAGKKAVSAATDLNESMNMVNQVFGRGAPMVQEWATTTADALGIARSEALQGAGSIGSMLVPMGIGRKRASEMSVEMAQLASDMASFNNEDPTEMLDRIRAGLSGESEPLKRFGTVLSETRVAQHAMTTGLVEQGEELTEQDKILGRYSLLLKDTKDQQGDFGRTSNDLANLTRRLKANLTDLAASAGQMLLPAIEDGARAMNKLVKEFRTGTGTGGDIRDALKGIGATLLPLGRTLVDVGKAAVAFGRWLKDNPDDARRLGVAVTALAGALVGLRIIRSVSRWLRGAKTAFNLFRASLLTAKHGGTAAARFASGLTGGIKAAAKGLRGVFSRVLESVGLSGGDRAATGAATNLSGGLEKNYGKGGGGRSRLRGVFRGLGLVLGAAMAAAVVSKLPELGDKITKFFGDKFGNPPTADEQRDARRAASPFMLPIEIGSDLGRSLGLPFAKGTRFAPGGLSLVGEQGPELVNLPRGSRVFPADETRQMLAPRTVTTPVATTGASPMVRVDLRTEVPIVIDNREVARAVARHTRDVAARA